MKVAMIAAMSLPGCIIGKDGELPWKKISADMHRFVRLTNGKPVIMGRKTLEDIGKPLPGRVNIILSRHPKEGVGGIHYARNKEEALEFACALSPSADQVIVIGGGLVYRLFMETAQILYITLVKGNFSGDTVFPGIDMNHWRVIEYEEVPEGKHTPYPLRFVTYKKIF